MPSNFRTPYLAAAHIHALPSHVPLGDLGLLPVNAYLIDRLEPILVDTGLAIDRGHFESALWSLVDPREPDDVRSVREVVDGTASSLTKRTGSP